MRGILLLYGMYNLKCPICDKKVDDSLTPYEADKLSCIVLCENEYFYHAMVPNGTNLVVRKERSMIKELMSIL